MAEDGSQPVAWTGQAFPYLMHHPKDLSSDSYARASGRSGSAPASHGASSGSARPRSTNAHGVWDGPAPRGSGRAPTHASDPRPKMAGSAASAAASGPLILPRSVPLPGGGDLPLLGLGTYKLSDPSSVLDLAVELGYAHIDCASVYGNEKEVGEALEAVVAKRGREAVFVTSKVWNDAHRPELAIASVEKSIKDLRLEHLDLVLIHWPDAWKPDGSKERDDSVTILDTYRALESLVDRGLVRYLGVSNFSLEQLQDLVRDARIRPVVNEIELHPLLSQRKLVGGALRLGIRSIAYAPIARGVVLQEPAIKDVAEQLGVSTSQVALRWNVQRGVAVIPKASSEKHLRDNANIFSFELDYQQKAALDALDQGKRFVTNEWHVFE